MLDTKDTQRWPLGFFLSPSCCRGPWTAGEAHPGSKPCAVSSHQFSKAQPLSHPSGLHHPLLSAALPLSGEISGSKAGADGDKECFQCSKTIIPLCLIKFSAAIRYSKTVCSSEKSLSFHTSPLKCPPHFGSQTRKYWECGSVILIFPLPHTTNPGTGLCYCVTSTGPTVL